MSNALTPEQQHSIVTAYSVPLPEPVDDVRVTWRGETEFLRSEADYYTADQMRSYATAVSAHKDAEIAALRAEAAGLRECAIDLWMMLDDIDTGGDRAKADDVLYRAIAERTHRRRFSPKYQIVIDAIDAARKGEATTPPPSPSPRS